ncbi:hypothetical protein pEaSNUABM9_00144 [Erwinia phage pEa_SNUABM_9]|nr:hypothetical protein pEaSNUABM9_00144 [Erwinia phage pEa_SNUABM_9]
MKVIFYLSSDEFREIFLKSDRKITDQLCEAILMSLPQEYIHYAKFIAQIEMENVRAQLADLADTIATIEFSDVEAVELEKHPDKLPVREMETWNKLILSRGEKLFTLFDEGLSQDKLVAETREETDTLRLAYASIDREELRKRYLETIAKSFSLIAKEVYSTICHWSAKYVVRFGKK